MALYGSSAVCVRQALNEEVDLSKALQSCSCHSQTSSIWHSRTPKYLLVMLRGHNLEGVAENTASLGATENVKPILQAMVIADRVYRDGVTGKHIIAGTFNRLFFSKGPPIVPPADAGGQPKMIGGLDAGSPYAYISLTDVRGKVPLVFRYVDLQDNTPILQANVVVEASSPLDMVEFVLPLPKLPVPHAGVFAFELLYNDEPVGSHRIVVEEMKPPQTDAPPPSSEGLDT
jgi:hypothetical protein